MKKNELKEILFYQCNGDVRMANDLLSQIERSLNDEGKTIADVNDFKITRNDYIEKEPDEFNDQVIHFTLNNCDCETCLSYHKEYAINQKQFRLTGEEVTALLDALKCEQYREAKCGSRYSATRLQELIDRIQEQVK